VIELSDRLITSISVINERAIDHFFGMINERAIDLFLVIKQQVCINTFFTFNKKAKAKPKR
jgi:hypothetical protein